MSSRTSLGGVAKIMQDRCQNVFSNPAQNIISVAPAWLRSRHSDLPAREELSETTMALFHHHYSAISPPHGENNTHNEDKIRRRTILSGALRMPCIFQYDYMKNAVCTPWRGSFSSHFPSRVVKKLFAPSGLSLQ